MSATSVRELQRSVVKLFTVIREPSYYQPWDFGYQRNSGGSGCILPGHRILTNAHVVSNQVYVQVLKAGDTRKYTAHVEHVDHGSETALLTVEDPRFFEGTVPVTFGGLPDRQDRVAAFGFPIGGNELSITQGVVSRIEVMTYTHSARELLAIQIDAAINPGNSGGPVFKDGRAIGIAFQSYAGERRIEKSGYVVPVPVIQHFLDDVATGHCDGVPALGVHWQRLEGDTLRAYLGMGPEQAGVLVTRVVHGSSADGVLQEQDVITAVSGAAVANDGTVVVEEVERVVFSHVVSQGQVGDELPLTVLRGGRVREVTLRLRPPSSLVPPPRYDVRPTYLIFGGVVFTPLTRNYIDVWEGADVDPRFAYYAVDGLPSPERREVVVVNQVLAHDVNVGYHRLHNAVVDSINGRPITAMADVLPALEAPVRGFHVIELDHHAGRGRGSDYSASFGTRLVLDAALVAQADREILARYGIDHDRSEDLAAPG